MAKQRNFGFHFCIRGSAHGRNDPRRLERNLLCEISPTSGGYRLNTGPTQPEGHNLRRLHAAVHVARGSLNTGRRFWVALFLSVVLSVSACDASAVADPNALWNIVHGECVPHMEAGLGPKPCERVDLAGGVAEGVAILKDLVGVSQMLAIPTRRITGIEDPQMLAPDAPINDLAWAWHTPGNVKLLLPPRQSRGNSHYISMPPRRGAPLTPAGGKGRKRHGA